MALPLSTQLQSQRPPQADYSRIPPSLRPSRFAALAATPSFAPPLDGSSNAFLDAGASNVPALTANGESQSSASKSFMGAGSFFSRRRDAAAAHSKSGSGASLHALPRSSSAAARDKNDGGSPSLRAARQNLGVVSRRKSAFERLNASAFDSFIGSLESKITSALRGGEERPRKETPIRDKGKEKERDRAGDEDVFGDVVDVQAGEPEREQSARCVSLPRLSAFHPSEC